MMKNNRNIKKAAMFGLDARIALAIFGALSVISGAALYSAIQKSKVTSIIVEMKEIGKAFESYYLDTGFLLPHYVTDTSSDDYYLLKTISLALDPSISGWNGPYYSPASTLPDIMVNKDQHNIWLLIASSNDDWTNFRSTEAKCTIGKQCYIWVRKYFVSEIYPDSIKNAIDKVIDGSDGADKGSFRWDSLSVNLKYMPVDNPHD